MDNIQRMSQTQTGIVKVSRREAIRRAGGSILGGVTAASLATTSAGPVLAQANRIAVYMDLAIIDYEVSWDDPFDIKFVAILRKVGAPDPPGAGLTVRLFIDKPGQEDAREISRVSTRGSNPTVAFFTRAREEFNPRLTSGRYRVWAYLDAQESSSERFLAAYSPAAILVVK
jgi:hypothetical protein